MNTRNWIDIDSGKHSLSAYEVSKKVIHLLRHSQQVHREEDGAVHFWFCLLILGTSHKDPDEIDLSVPRRAQYLHNAWKRHQDAVYWVDINLAIRKGLTLYQTRSNAIILQKLLD